MPDLAHLSLATAFVVLVACGDDATPPAGDGGRSDGGSRSDGGREGDDAGPPVDGGRLPDAGLPTAASFPLRILHPRAVGTSPDAGAPAIEASHRIYWAYPGIEYNVRATVVGGAYPYRYELTNAPAGMTIDASGTISWPDPRANAADIALTVTDATGETVQESWSITVDASRFLFVDAVRGVNAADNGCTSGCGTGTLENPWRTISDVYEGNEDISTYAGRILYFRAGTYDVLDIPRERVGGHWEQVTFFSSLKPAVWLEYPGEDALIDFGFEPGVETGPLIRFGGASIYVDGFETIRSHYIAWQVEPGSHYAVFRRMEMHQHGPGEEGANSSFIMTMTGSDNPSHYMAIQDNDCYDFSVSVAIKIYSTFAMVFDDNVFHGGPNPIELKADIRQFTMQNNVLYDVEGIALGGNMHDATTHGEFRFNVVRDATHAALRLNQDGMAGAIRVYRNTLIGRTLVSNTDAADGPFDFQDNVMVDTTPEGSCVPGSIIDCEDVTDPTRVRIAEPPDEDLQCTPDDGCVDANGILQGARHEMFAGIKGHEVP
jgi:hypothetical protein